MKNMYHAETAGSAHRAVAGHPAPHAIAHPAIPALQKKDTDEELQLKTAVQLKSPEEEFLQKKEDTSSQAPNKTGMPDNLKAGIENLSGYSMDDVKVHYNSSQPAQLNALAYAQGTDIHIGPGQERHLPHEAWHVVQQKQGRVRPTMQAKGVAINDDKGLEKEADVMGGKALQMKKVSQWQGLEDEKSTQDPTPEEQAKIEEQGGAIQAKLKNPLINNRIIQRAYTARRPLGGKISFGLESRWIKNKGVFHEHIFFEDGGHPPDIGFHNGEDKLFQDSADMIGLYIKIRQNLNDSIMREAVRNVGDPGTYSLLGNNCQAYVERVLIEYERIEANPSGNQEVFDSIGNDML